LFTEHFSCAPLKWRKVLFFSWVGFFPLPRMIPPYQPTASPPFQHSSFSLPFFFLSPCLVRNSVVPPFSGTPGPFPWKPSPFYPPLIISLPFLQVFFFLLSSRLAIFCFFLFFFFFFRGTTGSRVACLDLVPPPQIFFFSFFPRDNPVRSPLSSVFSFLFPPSSFFSLCS